MQKNSSASNVSMLSTCIWWQKYKLDKNGKIHECDHLYMLLVIHFHIA